IDFGEIRSGSSAVGLGGGLDADMEALLSGSVDPLAGSFKPTGTEGASADPLTDIKIPPPARAVQVPDPDADEDDDDDFDPL
ncbi:MAG TPA: hypothetical protein P5218_13810, partial [Planctomycetota bacterium]|nr:hypothetical protein [Planctomycetota bacterium]